MEMKPVEEGEDDDHLASVEWKSTVQLMGMRGVGKKNNTLQDAYVFTINELQQERHFGFVVFRTRQEAEQALQLFNGTPMPQTKRHPFMLKWSSSRRLFNGNPQVSYDMLEDLFNVNGAMDSVYVNQSGETVVQFTNEHEKLQALQMADWTPYLNLNICVRLISHSENRREYLPIPCPKGYLTDWKLWPSLLSR